MSGTHNPSNIYILFQGMLPFMHETCNRIINRMDEFSQNGNEFELKTILGKFTLDTIASCAVGIDPKATGD